MKERDEETCPWPCRLKRKEPVKTRSRRYSMDDKGNLNLDHRGRKRASSFRKLATNCLHFQLFLAVILIVESMWYDYFQAPSSIETSIELFCKNSSAWASDALWRTSAHRPRLCPPKRGDPAVDWEQRGLDAQQLQETINFRTPCGAYCAFRTDTLSFANSVVVGWLLTDHSGKGSRGCWEPILDMHTHDCSKWFDDWKAWMLESNKLLSKPSLEAERHAQALASMSEKIGGKCQNHESWKKNSFWRNSVEDPAVCYIGVPTPDESLKLGKSHLINSLATRTWCGSYCVFHVESSPVHAVAGATAGQKLKGWSLGKLEKGNAEKGCFRPIENITSSHCNQWYEKWAIWVNSTVAGQS
ncbi:hypothetical protein MHU86_14583 [Fragilaria crotonensis]|nr:hypothetical protein MHU86_14583 [Fragilaria crotonensis]